MSQISLLCEKQLVVGGGALPATPGGIYSDLCQVRWIMYLTALTFFQQVIVRDVARVMRFPSLIRCALCTETSEMHCGVLVQG